MADLTFTVFGLALNFVGVVIFAYMEFISTSKMMQVSAAHLDENVDAVNEYKRRRLLAAVALGITALGFLVQLAGVLI